MNAFVVIFLVNAELPGSCLLSTKSGLFENKDDHNVQKLQLFQHSCYLTKIFVYFKAELLLLLPT